MIWLVIVTAIIVIPIYCFGTFIFFMMTGFAYDASDEQVSRAYRFGRRYFLPAFWLAWIGLGFGFLGWCAWMLRG